MTSGSSETEQLRVTLQFPERREILWTDRDSPHLGWQVGHTIEHRTASWVVLSRSESELDASLTLVLGVA